MSKGRVERLEAILARSFSDDSHERHEDPNEAVLEYPQPNDLLSLSATSNIKTILVARDTDIEPRQSTLRDPPRSMIS